MKNFCCKQGSVRAFGVRASSGLGSLRRTPVRRFIGGFSLIELMVSLAVVGVLMAVAVPIYTGTVTQSRLTDATSTLATWQIKMEQWFQDNLSYYAAASTTVCGVAVPSTSNYFTFSCTPTSATAYTLTATGSGSMTGFSYSINQDGTRSSAVTATGWASTSTTCWITEKGGRC